MSQCIWLAANNTISLELLKERYAQVLQLWEQGKCYSPLGLFYTSVRDNYDPRTNGGMMGQSGEVVQLEQLVRQATKRAEYQSREWQLENIDSNNKEGVRRPSSIKPPSNIVREIDKETYPRNQKYNQERKGHNYSKIGRRFYARHNRYGYNSPLPHRSLPSWSYNQSSPEILKAVEPEDSNCTLGEKDVYLSEFDKAKLVIDPRLALARVGEALGDIYRRTDLQAKLAKASLAVDRAEKKASITFIGSGVELRTLLATDRALIQLAFSQKVARGYSLVFDG